MPQQTAVVADQFWDFVTDGLDVHPSYVERLHNRRPHLPEEPSIEQFEAWIELAEIVQAGVAADSPQSRDIANRVAADTAEFTAAPAGRGDRAPAGRLQASFVVWT